jgi:branched-chain amino acid aminotransferase
LREWVSLNGTLLPAEEAHISVFDSGVMQGVGLFETMRAYDRRIFREQQHLDRLAGSAVKLGWTVVPEVEDLRENIQQVVVASQASDLRVRLTVTTGSLRPLQRERPTLTIIATAAPESRYPEELYAKGVTVIVSSYRQSRHDPTVGHKTTSYFARLASLREVHSQNAFEALWLTDDGHVAEGAISSLFMVKDEALYVPPLETPILPGITRAAVIELAGAMGISVHERPLAVDDVRAADEVFLTNSMMEVMPVVRLMREAIGTEKPGELTRKLAGAYADLVQRECGHG